MSYKVSSSLDAFMIQIAPDGNLGDASIMEDMSNTFSVNIITVVLKEVSSPLGGLSE